MPTEIWDLFNYYGEGHLSGRKETGSEGRPQSCLCKSPITVGPGQPIPPPATLPSFLLDSPRSPQDPGSWERGDYWSMTSPVNQAKQNLQIAQHLPLFHHPSTTPPSLIQTLPSQNTFRNKAFKTPGNESSPQLPTQSFPLLFCFGR